MARTVARVVPVGALLNDALERVQSPVAKQGGWLAPLLPQAIVIEMNEGGGREVQGLKESRRLATNRPMGWMGSGGWVALKEGPVLRVALPQPLRLPLQLKPRRLRGGGGGDKIGGVGGG